MAKLQYTNTDTAIPYPGDIAVLSTENASAIIGLANSNSLVILGTWIDNPNPGFVGTVEDDVVYVNCEVLPNLGDKLYLSAANKGKVTNIAPANAYFIGSVLQVGQQIGSYYQIKTVFNKYGSPLATPSSPGAAPHWPPTTGNAGDIVVDIPASGVVGAFTAGAASIAPGTDNASRYPIAAARTLSQASALTLTTTGTPVVGNKIIACYALSLGYVLSIVNGGPLANTLGTFAATLTNPLGLVVYWDGTNYKFNGYVCLS